jgi:hypothetical protein
MMRRFVSLPTPGVLSVRRAASVLAGLLTVVLLTACGADPSARFVATEQAMASPTPAPDATPTSTPKRAPDRATRGSQNPAAAPPASAGWNVAPGGTGVVGAGRMFRYRVEVEPATGADPAAFADMVDATLAGSRGWTRDSNAFQRVSSGTVEMVVRLATPSTVDRLCAAAGLKTNGEVSCRVGSQVVLNQRRWDSGVPAYAGDLGSYRILLINHEVGHRLGHSGHPPCPGAGLPQPVMMQVFYTGLQGCAKNVWPYAEDGTRIG